MLGEFCRLRPVMDVLEPFPKSGRPIASSGERRRTANRPFFLGIEHPKVVWEVERIAQGNGRRIDKRSAEENRKPRGN